MKNLMPQSHRSALLLIPGLMLVLAAAALNIAAGAADLPLVSVWNALWGSETEHVQRVVWEMRLPRALLGALVGIHFGVSGLILQTLTRNPLADAGILGIAAGASLMAVLALLLSGHWLDLNDPYRQLSLALEYLPLLAILGGLAASGLIYWLSGGGRLTPLKLILTGVTIASVLNALVTGCLAMWGHVQTEVIIQWLAGSLYGRNWQHLQVILPWSLVGLGLCVLIRRPLQLMRFEDEQALSLGLAVRRWRLLALLCATLLAASAVGVVGPVGFVGLLVPHIVRPLAPGRLGLQLWLCGLVGALLVMLGDVTGRLVLIPYELPIGVVSALLGVPFFLLLLHRQR